MASAVVTRLDLTAVLEAKRSPKESVSDAKSSPHFIPLHLTEVQHEQAPTEGESIVTPRSRSGSVASNKNTPRADSGSDSNLSSSPRTPSTGRTSNVDRLQTCTECGRIEQAPIHGACSWKCLVKTRIRGKDDASSPRDDISPSA